MVMLVTVLVATAAHEPGLRSVMVRCTGCKALALRAEMNTGQCLRPYR